VSTLAVQRLGRRAKLFLALEIVSAYLQVRRLRGAPLPAVLRTLRSENPLDSEPTTVEDALRLGRAVRRTLALLPADTRCLTQSLVLTKLLSRRGLASELVIGVDHGETFAAHAWVERDRVPLLPPLEHRFERLARL
jgi:hypothetical protein